MQRVIIMLLAGAAAIVVVFIALPSVHIDRGIGPMSVDYYWKGDPRPQKSELRKAIEGQLAWLGVI
jgi:hypothetical protein